MIRVRYKDMYKASPRCHADCKNYRPEGCITECTMRYRGIYTCEYCEVTACFYGANNPIYCTACKKVLPDYWKLGRVLVADERIKYHLGAHKC
jgi:hypothetical protein